MQLGPKFNLAPLRSPCSIDRIVPEAVAQLFATLLAALVCLSASADSGQWQLKFGDFPVGPHSGEFSHVKFTAAPYSGPLPADPWDTAAPNCSGHGLVISEDHTGVEIEDNDPSNLNESRNGVLTATFPSGERPISVAFKLYQHGTAVKVPVTAYDASGAEIYSNPGSAVAVLNVVVSSGTTPIASIKINGSEPYVVDCFTGTVSAPSEYPVTYATLPPPEPWQTKLVLLTHGCCTAADDLAESWIPLAEAIQKAADPSWQVVLWDWTPSPTLPVLAWVSAAQRGLDLGEQIHDRHYEAVHFVSHSAGAALISVASAKLRQDSPASELTIQETYLDPYGPLLLNELGGLPFYGLNANWAETYFAKDIGDILDGLLTYLQPPNAFKAEVTAADPNAILGVSTHQWPRCFYRATVDGAGDLTCDYSLPAATAGLGFGLSMEAHPELTREEWDALISDEHPVADTVVVGPGARDEGGGGPTLDDGKVYRSWWDSEVDLAAQPITVSESGSVDVDPLARTIVLSCPAARGGPSSPAWFVAPRPVGHPINMLRFECRSTSAGAGAGLLTVSLGDSVIGFVDQRFIDGEGVAEVFAGDAELDPGTVCISLRLDAGDAQGVAATVSNIQIGYGSRVKPADLNVDHVVDAADLGLLLGAWGSASSVNDVDGDGTVNAVDLGILLGSWGPE